MTKQKKELFILLIVVLILMIALPRVLCKKNAEVAVSQETVSTVSQPLVYGFGEDPSRMQEQVSQGVTEPTGFQHESFTSNSPDPFDLPVDLQGKFIMLEETEGEKDDKEVALPNINLYGVVWGTDTPVAFINDKAYKIGDTVSDAKILEIAKKGVCFLYNGKKSWMKVKK